MIENTVLLNHKKRPISLDLREGWTVTLTKDTKSATVSFSLDYYFYNSNNIIIGVRIYPSVKKESILRENTSNNNEFDSKIMHKKTVVIELTTL